MGLLVRMPAFVHPDHHKQAKTRIVSPQMRVDAIGPQIHPAVFTERLAPPQGALLAPAGLQARNDGWRPPCSLFTNQGLERFRWEALWTPAGTATPRGEPTRYGHTVRRGASVRFRHTPARRDLRLRRLQCSGCGHWLFLIGRQHPGRYRTPEMIQ